MSFCTSRKGLFGGDDGELRFGRAGELQEIPDDAFEPVDFAGDEFGVRMFRGAGLEVFLLHVKPGLDGGEGIADFVRDAGGQMPQRRQFFLAFHQLPAFHQLHLQGAIMSR